MIDRFNMNSWDNIPMPELSEAAKEYVKTYPGARLLAAYKLNEYGVWKLDLDDSTPVGYYKGALGDVINHVVGINEYCRFQGYFTKIEPEIIRRT